MWDKEVASNRDEERPPCPEETKFRQMRYDIR